MGRFYFSKVSLGREEGVGEDEQDGRMGKNEGGEGGEGSEGGEGESVASHGVCLRMDSGIKPKRRYFQGSIP